MEKNFPFRVVLSALTGLKICPDIELFRLYQHMVGAAIFAHQLPAICLVCKTILVKLDPRISQSFDTKAVTEEANRVGDDGGILAECELMEQKVAEAQVKFGADAFLIEEGCAANPNQKMHELLTWEAIEGCHDHG